jgi:hypothetical protein
MRNFGATALLLGGLGYFYCSDQLGRYAVPSQDTSVAKALATPGGRWQVAQYACVTFGALGALMLLFPKGR